MEDQNDSGTKATENPEPKPDEQSADQASPAEPSAEPFDFSNIPGLDFETPAPDSLEQAPAPETAAPHEEAKAADLDAMEQTYAPAPVPASAPLDTSAIDNVKAFAENVQMEKVEIPAAFPFSLLIQGLLTPEEKEKLLDVISRENMGFREVDLEPQFESGKILIPRISEYAGILLVQALRGTSAKMRLGPSDSIFATADTENKSDPMQAHLMGFGAQAEVASQETVIHPADDLPMTTDAFLPQFPTFQTIDTIIATAIVETRTIEGRGTEDYTAIVENLKREIKYKAHRKGAQGIIQFKLDLQQLSLATQYRVTATAVAVRAEKLRARPPDVHASLDEK